MENGNIYLFVCWVVLLFAYLFVCLSVCLFVCFAVCPRYFMPKLVRLANSQFFFFL